MNILKSFSILATMSGALLLTACNSGKEEVAPEQAIDLSIEHAPRIEDPTAAASPNGRVQVTVHTHTYSSQYSSGNRYLDNDFMMVVEGCSLTNGTGEEIARTPKGQEIINSFGGPGGIGTTRAASTVFPGSARYTSTYGNGRVVRAYYNSGELSSNLKDLLVRDCALRTQQ